MPTFALTAGVTSSPGWGDRWKFIFTHVWVGLDNWSLKGTYQTGLITVGAGDVTPVALSNLPSFCFTYKNRVYLANGARFNFSDNSAPTEFESQGPGAGFVLYLSQLGGQDSVQSFGQLQGRLAVLGRRSIQLWQVDADPNNFSLVQQLDNIGTIAPLSVQNQGDFDVIFLDDTGVRSLRSREVTLNAYSDDMGAQVDALVQAAVASAGGGGSACAAVDPVTKNYWLAIGQTIFVHSRYPSSKISAWSTYEARGDNNVLFTPAKFVVYKGQVFCRSVENGHYTYGGANDTTYDINSQVSFQIPWLDFKQPDMMKQVQAINTIMEGKWKFLIGMNPKVALQDIGLSIGNAATPDSLQDSTYDLGEFHYSEQGTHFSLQAISQSTSTTTPVVFSALAVHYNKAQIQ